MAGDALEVDRDEDLEQLREPTGGEVGEYGGSVGEYAGVVGGGEGEDSMLETSLSLEDVNVSLL